MVGQCRKSFEQIILIGLKILFNLMKISYKNEESDEGYFLKAGVQYLEKLHELHNGLLFLPERMKIVKVEKTAANLHDKTEYVEHIRSLKQALNDELVFKKRSN